MDALALPGDNRLVLGRNQKCCESPWSPTPEKGSNMRKSEKISYVMIFCALMLVKNSRMNLTDLATLFPFTGKAEFLARELAGVAPTES